MTLTSLDYSRLLQYIAIRKHMIRLNKTQVNKILYYVYGTCLVKFGEPLFVNEKPQAWVYGPVFPRVYKGTDSDEFVFDYPKDKLETINNEGKLSTIVEIVDNMYSKSASTLVRWSHQPESPWYNTIYDIDDNGNLRSQRPWSTRIDDDLTIEYFNKPENRIYGGN